MKYNTQKISLMCSITFCLALSSQAHFAGGIADIPDYSAVPPRISRVRMPDPSFQQGPAREGVMFFMCENDTHEHQIRQVSRQRFFNELRQALYQHFHGHSES